MEGGKGSCTGCAGGACPHLSVLLVSHLPLTLSSCGVGKRHSTWGQQPQWLHCPLRGWVALAQRYFLVFVVVRSHQG